MALSAADKLTRARVSILRDKAYMAWAALLTVGKVELTTEIPMACTDGRNELYNPDFIASLTHAELRFLILHENLHKAFMHLTVWSKLAEKHGRLCNMACDHVINLLLYYSDPEEKNIMHPRMPDGTRIGCHDERFKGMNTKQVFDILFKEQQANGGKPKGGDGTGFDEHDWEGAKALSPKETKQLSREIEQALRQGRMAQEREAGKDNPSDIELAINDLLEPKVDWRDVLREFVTVQCAGTDESSWARPNRKMMAHGHILPGMVSERVGHLLIGVDTSGSINADELTRAMSEVVAIASDVAPDITDLVYWGHGIAGHERYDQHSVVNLIDSTRPLCGGGTAPQCVSDWLAEQGEVPQAIIMFTDGYVPDWGRNWPAPVMWVIIGNNNARPDTGVVVHAED